MRSDARALYPEIEAHHVGTLRVSALHELYYEVSGNPAGKPVVFLHGGPGGGSDPRYRRFFDPARYRIVLFDQRGSGQSTPYASLEENTTAHLVQDMEALRTHLGIERWQVFGGSWGSTLALAYAQAHPARVTELILRGIFLLRRKEIQWFYQHGASELFPDAWERFVAPIPEAEHHDLVSAYHKRLTGDDPVERSRCAVAWSVWEGSTSRLIPDPDMIRRTGDEHFAEAFAQVDVLATPTSPTVAFALGARTADPLAMYLADACTLPPSLAGVPAISVPTGVGPSGLPVGLQLVGPVFSEARLLAVAHAVESLLGRVGAPWS